MSTYSITFDENRFGYLLNLFNDLGISFREIENDEYIPRTAEQIEVDLRSAFKEVKLHQEGKIQLRDARVALNEL